MKSMIQAKVTSAAFTQKARRLFYGASLFIAPLTCVAQDEENPSVKTEELKTKPSKPLVKKLKNGNYQIGKINFHKDTRVITLPAFANIVTSDTPIEYLLVHLNGDKVHEALFITEADPSHLNIALKLLGYKESKELFRIYNEDGSLGAKYHQESDAIKKSARFFIHVNWTNKEVKKNKAVTQWLINGKNSKPMPSTPWVYNGSYVHRQKFQAKISGSIFSILPDPGAIANYPGADRYNDSLWLVAEDLAKEGTPVTITLAPSAL